MAEQNEQSREEFDKDLIAEESEGDHAPLPEAGQDSPWDDLVTQLRSQPLNVPLLADAVGHQDAPDAADILEDLEEDQAAEVLVEMETKAAAETLAEMEKPLAVAVVDDLIDEGNLAYTAQLLQLMAPDDAADILQLLDERRRESLLAHIPIRVAPKLRRLIRYDEESAGGLMTTDYLAVHEDMTVADAVGLVRSRSLPELQRDLLVIRDDGSLVGIIGLRELLVNQADCPIADLTDHSIETVRPETDREAVAHEFDRYDYTMMPVTDEAGRLIGIVTVDDVIDIIRREQTEDVQKTVGAGAVEAIYSGVLEKFRGRFPWLGASLIMTCLAAAIILIFEDLIAELPILAFLMPVVAALVGNAGHQALAVTLRGIVLDEVRPERIWPLILREGAIGILNGAVLGLALFAGMSVLATVTDHANWRIGLIAGIAATLAMGVGTLAGSGIPLLMRRLGADPAQSSAIFLIMITDAVSFSSILLLAVLLAGLST